MENIGIFIMATAVGLAWFGFSLWLLIDGVSNSEWPFAAWGLFFIAVGAGFLIAMAGHAADDHPTIALDAREWVCTETQAYWTTMLVGKVVVPVQRSRCIAWRGR